MPTDNVKCSRCDSAPCVCPRRPPTAAELRAETATKLRWLADQFEADQAVGYVEIRAEEATSRCWWKIQAATTHNPPWSE